MLFSLSALSLCESKLGEGNANDGDEECYDRYLLSNYRNEVGDEES